MAAEEHFAVIEEDDDFEEFNVEGEIAIEITYNIDCCLCSLTAISQLSNNNLFCDARMGSIRQRCRRIGASLAR
jgi:hypothetical protein